jgi:predicted dehydrogenase
MSPEQDSRASRRQFLKRSAVATGAVVGNLSMAHRVHAEGNDRLRVGLIGCGNRGSGAALDALKADQGARLVAMGDLFSDRLESSLKNLSKEPDVDIDVPQERRFVGFDAFQRVIDCGVDVVILATPPQFRPAHLQAAVAANKHCFVEKPVAVDAPGVRSVLATCDEAQRKGLSIVSGLCYRYDLAKRETLSRIHDGAIGDIVTLQASYFATTLKYFPRQETWSDLEFLMRNWQYFTWLSGDHIVEQHIHSLDKAAWAMHDVPPLKCIGVGGKQVLPSPEYGTVFDHFSVVYEYESGQKLFSRCRQMDGCALDVSDHFLGTKGSCALMKHSIEGETNWRFRGQSPNMYHQEHADLFASIRAGKPINNGLYMTRSTLMAIMGRMSAYTGQEITWEQALASQEGLAPAQYDWNSAPIPIVAKPGITRFV